eukprot:TRINITY_DN293_c2_g1_i2.p1 TRINITY_DN293_c2_g1~~TRINITY_DN293_c2_g1_i2.p1  ORF type:complete len:279 (-),score=113.36 TRINITY_DN293_c2_g1_i2:592-1428(-)
MSINDFNFNLTDFEEQSWTETDEEVCLAQDAIFENRLEDALKHIKIALQQKPNEIEALELLTGILLLQKKYNEAFEAAENWKQITKKTTVKQLRMIIECSYILNKVDKICEARVDLLRKLADTIDSQTVYFDAVMASIYVIDLGMKHDQLEGDVLELFDSDSETESIRAKVYSSWLLLKEKQNKSIEQIEEAIRNLEQIAQNSQNIDAILALTLLIIENQNLDKQQQYLQLAINLYGPLAPQSLFPHLFLTNQQNDSTTTTISTRQIHPLIQRRLLIN